MNTLYLNDVKDLITFKVNGREMPWFCPFVEIIC